MRELKFLEQQLTIIDEEGNETLCQILFTFESSEFNKKYVLFYPIEIEDENNGSVSVMAASYTEGEDGLGELEEIESEEEWKLIQQVLNDFEDTLEDYDEDDEDDDEDDEDDHHHHHHDSEQCEDCEDCEDCKDKDDDEGCGCH